ncbi:MAG: phosphoheptose isomerase [Candidatus Marinimicrobia bacterium]|nr:phosphoheptose isomerase [Candidatus Neomarinimicrobiota bacterium]
MGFSVNKKDKLFIDDYWSRYQKHFFESRDDESILKLRDSIKETNSIGGKLIFFGNGASASLSSHAATDFTKQAKIKAIAFNDHNIITALSNDYGYENWVSKAIEYYADKNDMVIFISVSGESINLVNGLNYALKNNLKIASITGSKKNNTLMKKSDYALWVNSKAYNIVESIHTIWVTLIIDLFVGHPEYSVQD